MKSGVPLGKTPSDVATFLMNPLNEEILKDLTVTIEAYWNQ
jgi:hypothetical protein